MNSISQCKAEERPRSQRITPPKPNKRKDSLQELRQKKYCDYLATDKKSPQKRTTLDTTKRVEMTIEPRGTAKKQKITSESNNIKNSVTVEEQTKVSNTLRRTASFPKNFTLKTPDKKSENLTSIKSTPFTCSRMHLHEIEWQKNVKKSPFQRSFSFCRTTTKSNERTTPPTEKNNVGIPAGQLRLSFRVSKNEVQDRPRSYAGPDKTDKKVLNQTFITPKKQVKKPMDADLKLAVIPPGNASNLSFINEEKYRTSPCNTQGMPGYMKSTIINKTDLNSPICFTGSFVSFRINDTKPNFENKLFSKMKNDIILEEGGGKRNTPLNLSANRTFNKETFVGMSKPNVYQSHQFSRETIMAGDLKLTSLNPGPDANISTDSNSNLITEDLSPIKKKALSLRLDLPRCLNDQVGPRRKLSKQYLNELTIYEKSELDVMRERLEENSKKQSRSFSDVKPAIDEALGLLRKELAIVHQQDQMLLRRLLRINDILCQMSRQRNYRYPQSSPCESNTTSFTSYLETLTPPEMSTQKTNGNSQFYYEIPLTKPKRKYSFDEQILSDFEFLSNKDKSVVNENPESEVTQGLYMMINPLPPVFMKRLSLPEPINSVSTPPQTPKDITDISVVSYKELLKKSASLDDKNVKLPSYTKRIIKTNGFV